jgi:hypothetical protein
VEIHEASLFTQAMNTAKRPTTMAPRGAHQKKDLTVLILVCLLLLAVQGPDWSNHHVNSPVCSDGTIVASSVPSTINSRWNRDAVIETLWWANELTFNHSLQNRAETLRLHRSL